MSARAKLPEPLDKLLRSQLENALLGPPRPKQDNPGIQPLLGRKQQREGRQVGGGGQIQPAEAPLADQIVPHRLPPLRGLEGLATRADVNEAIAFNGVERGISAIQQGICDSTYALNNSITSGFNNTNVALLQGFNGVQSQMCNMAAQAQDCCCQTQRAIDGVNYNMATNTCAIQNTIQNSTRDIIDSQNAGTREILNFLTQDKIASLQSENQALKFQASQTAQNSYLAAMSDAQTSELIRRINPMPVPAYQVPAPYPYCGTYNNGCGCGC